MPPNGYYGVPGSDLAVVPDFALMSQQMMQQTAATEHPKQAEKKKDPQIPALPEQRPEKKPKELTKIEKTQAELRRWQREQEKLERVNKELGRIGRSLAVMGEAPKEHKWTEG